MKMKSSYTLLFALSILVAGCGQAQPSAAADAAPAAKPHMNMLQLMRAFPFPHSNVLFDTQDVDPEGLDKKSSMVFSVYRWGDTDAYAGWEGVENSALALAETANLLTIPGRVCSTGLPAPIEREDWKKYSQGLVEAGQAAYKAAKSKNLDAMIEVTDTISIACSACHDVYRDIDQVGKTRCSVGE